MYWCFVHRASYGSAEQSNARISDLNEKVDNVSATNNCVCIVLRQVVVRHSQLIIPIHIQYASLIRHYSSDFDHSYFMALFISNTTHPILSTVHPYFGHCSSLFGRAHSCPLKLTNIENFLLIYVRTVL